MTPQQNTPQNTEQQKQFQAVENLLTGWLKARRKLLGRYTELAVALESDVAMDLLHDRQAKLCELLVDYISAGHFEIYHQLIEEAELFDDGGSGLAGKLMPAIGDSTQLILAYDEKYGSDTQDVAHIRNDLSALGERLESRFVLEDQLIAGLHGRHRRQVDDPAP